jgi:hypothetical protein
MKENTSIISDIERYTLWKTVFVFLRGKEKLTLHLDILKLQLCDQRE